MDCKETKKRLEEMMEKDMKGDKEFASHMGSCPECAEEYRIIKSIKQALSFKEETVIPADFNARVWKKIGEPSPSLLDRIFGFRPNAAFALKTAAAFAALVFMVIMAKNSFVKNDTFAAVSPQAQVKTVVAKITRHYKKPASVSPEAKKEDLAPQEVAINNVPENKAPENSAVNPGSSISSPGKGPVTAENRISFEFNRKEAPIAVKNEPVSSGVSIAGISKLTATAKPAQETISSPVEVRNNVFNPALGGKLTLRYEVKNAGQVTIQVYNKKGEPIRTIVRAERQSSIYEASWDGTFDNGAGAPAGMYIVYIKTDITEQKIKAALIK